MVSKEWHQLIPAEEPSLNRLCLMQSFHVSNLFHIQNKKKSQKKKMVSVPLVRFQTAGTRASDTLWGISLPFFMTTVAMQESQFLKDLLWWECPHCALKVINLTFHMRSSFVTVLPPSIYSVNAEKQKIRLCHPQVHLLFPPLSFKMRNSSWIDFICLWDFLEALE